MATAKTRVCTKRETLFAGGRAAVDPKAAAARVAAARKAAARGVGVAKAPPATKKVLPLNPSYKTHQRDDTVDGELYADGGWLCGDDELLRNSMEPVGRGMRSQPYGLGSISVL